VAGADVPGSRTIESEATNSVSEPVEIAKTGDLAVGSGKVCEVAGRSIALFRTETGFFAVDNECCHRGGPLGEGFVDGSVVTCPWHGWRFDVTTGRSPDDPAAVVGTHPVTVEGDSVRVEL
jgi:nitrite reductase/ring-hydroxylating ferredoxin subunit